MTDAAVPVAPVPAPLVPAPSTRKGFRFGLVSLICAVIAPSWLIFALYLVIVSQGSVLPGDAPQEHTALDYLSYFFVIAAYLVVPVLFVLAVIFAIVALVRNRRPGVIMGAATFVVLLLCLAGVFGIVAWFFDGIARVS